MASLKTIVGALTFLGLVAPVGLAHAQECAPFDSAKRSGEIANDTVDEASGLAASWRHEDLLWTHNDSGDKPRLYLMKQDGTHVATVIVEGVGEATDWEDIAVGPCQKDAKESCVYVADVGDNRSRRKEVVIHRFEEPDLPDELPADINVKVTEQTWFRYPGGARDAETVMVHPTTGAMYVIEKRIQGNSSVYRVPGQTGSNTKGSKKKPALAVEVGQLELGARAGFTSMITAGDISPDGAEFTVRTYLSVYTFCADGDDFETAVKAEPVESSVPFMIQSEALGYGRGGKAIWVTSERRPSPVYRIERQQPSASESDN